MNGSNRFTYGLGTIGRDMVYSMVSMYLIFYLTDVVAVSSGTLAWVTAIMLCCRIFDALNDPFMGMIVDNTHTKWGRFKPWIVVGLFCASVIVLLLFCDFGLSGGAFIAFFAVVYLMWGIAWTMNDIAYWSMIPSLTKDQKEREKIGAIARICASIGLFFVVTLIVPATNMLGNMAGSLQRGWFLFALVIVAAMILFQMITVFGVHELGEEASRAHEHTSIKEMFRAIFKNDQLLTAASSMALFMIGYMTTTAFGLYYFKYAYGNENMYSIFAVILGVSQIAALIIFPLLSKKFDRRALYLFAIFLVCVGYVIFFFAPLSTMIFVGAAGVLIFVGEAFIQLMCLMFLTDSVEYGEWKFHKRNDSVSLALQPFINKTGGAIASGIVGFTVIISGMNDAQGKADMTESGLTILKVAMMIFPLVCIVAGFLLWSKKYVLDEKTYKKIIDENKARREVHHGA